MHGNITGLRAAWNVSGTSDTILGSDRSTVVTYTSSSAIGITLPQAGSGTGTSSDFSKNFVVGLVCNTGLCTVTTSPANCPTNNCINGNATLQLQNQSCRIQSQDNANYLAACWNNNSQQPINTDTGSANAYVTACPGVAPTLQAGDTCLWIAAHANTSSSTVNASGTGVKNLTKYGATALVSGDIPGTPAVELMIYDGTEWEFQNPANVAGGTVTHTAGSLTAGNPVVGNGTADTYASTAYVDISAPNYTAGDICQKAAAAFTANPAATVDGRGLAAVGASSTLACSVNPVAACANGGKFLLPAQAIATDVTWLMGGNCTIEGVGRTNSSFVGSILQPSSGFHTSVEITGMKQTITGGNMVRGSDSLGTVTVTMPSIPPGVSGGLSMPFSLPAIAADGQPVQVGCSNAADINFTGLWRVESVTPTTLTFQQPGVAALTSTGNCTIIFHVPLLKVGSNTQTSAAFRCRVEHMTLSGDVGSSHYGVVPFENQNCQEASLFNDIGIRDFNMAGISALW